MTGDRSLFKVFESKKGGNVTFDDGSKSQIKGKGTISLLGLLDIANVLYVEGLRVNLLSISQICDQDFMLGKQTKVKRLDTQTSATSRPLELLHLNLMGLTRTESLGGKRYIMVVVDDFTSDEGIFLGYSSTNKAYRVYNKRTKKVMEIVNVVTDEASTNISTSLDSESHKEKRLSSRIKLNHPPEVIVGNMNELTLRKRTVDKCVANFVSYSCHLSQVEPTKVEEALQDESWVEAMHDELLQFQRNDVWTLVPRPEGEHIIGTKWILCNKTDEEGNVIHNKARLVVQGYFQMEGVDYNKTFTLVARMESIRILLALGCHLKFKFYQMDVKTAFLNELLKEDAYMAQPKGFIDPHFPDHVLYLKKALYGLKQAPRVWHDRLTQYLVSHGFTKGKADHTLFIKREGDELIVA
ncbi:uncharacterized protein LOC142634281 [Castanea sativa]|uniref:uncharacterized protein LOC142634281 n=1 Tax=Castanea sativa TaxID=21020 RepID=UPI003F6502E2